MTLITIEELTGQDDGANALVQINHGEKYRISISDPFSEAEEARLEWYFERYLEFPFTHTVDFQEAAASIDGYGESLFNQVFANREAWRIYKNAVNSGLENLVFEIAGSPDFHRLHWEALKDPEIKEPLSVQVPIIRRNINPQPRPARVRPSPTINILVVTARPGEARDVGYRTISRPLVEMVQNSGLRVRVKLLRPGTYRALVEELESVRDKAETGYYHLIHFDCHGALLTYDDLERILKPDQLVFQTGYGRDDIEKYEGVKAFLSLEQETGKGPDLVEAEQMADLLVKNQVPVVVLNACQSGKQIKVEDNDSAMPPEARETSLGARLIRSGVQAVLAMGYSVTVSAAEVMMGRLYEQLFAGQDLTRAVRRARLELHHQKERRVYFNQRIDLEDWVLPVHYTNQDPVSGQAVIQVREFTPQEEATYYEERAARAYQAPRTTYGFIGRDLDVLRIERLVFSKNNVLLVRGMGGSGKTTLLHHLASWWQATEFVDRVFYFEYDQRAWTRQQIMEAMARGLLSEADYVTRFQPLSLDAQQQFLVDRLRAHRHLLVLDNLESITGENLAIRNVLDPGEREALRGFVSDLAGGQSFVMLGSRGKEAWLAPGTFNDNVYELPGLDPESASTLADLVLERHNATQYRQDPKFEELLKLLDGYPLPIEVVLANLAHQTPAEIIAALFEGDDTIDFDDEDKTKSVLKCIDYSHGNLSPQAQDLLACLAPFVGVVNTQLLPVYSEQLQKQPVLADLPFDRWEEVLQEAANWGLVTLHPDAPMFLKLQPTLPFFLRHRLAAPDRADKRRAIDAAFRAHYKGIGWAIFDLFQSKDAEKKQTGLVLAALEYENLVHALNLSMAARASIGPFHAPLSMYLDRVKERRRALVLGESILKQIDDYPQYVLAGPLGHEFVMFLHAHANVIFDMKNYQVAAEYYHRILKLVDKLEAVEEKEKWRIRSGTYHQLGYVAQEQRQWDKAEAHYRKALEIWNKLGDRYAQGSTYHQLGMVAQAQQQWERAEAHYQKALKIKSEFNDQYSKAPTYGQLALLALDKEQWDHAEAYFQKALEIFIEFNDRYNQAKVYHQLGRVAQAQRQWEQAEAHFQKALEIKSEFNDRYEQAGTYHQLGRVAEEQAQWDQARNYYLTALKTYQAYNDGHKSAIVLGSLARLWRASGNKSLPTAVAEIFKATPKEVEILFKEALDDDK